MNRRFRTSACTATAIVALAACEPASPPRDTPPSPAPSPAPSEAPSEAPGTPSAPAAPPTSRPARGPGDAPPADDPGRSDATDATVATFLGFRAPKPATWLWQPPTSSMRAANYVVPATSGANQAHLVVFQGIGGGVQANITRWKGQFRTADQHAVEPIVSTIEAAGVPITLVELAGEQQRMGEQWFTPDQLFLGAIVEAPQGDIFIRLAGDRETVDANRAAFMTLVRGLERP